MAIPQREGVYRDRFCSKLSRDPVHAHGGRENGVCSLRDRSPLLLDIRDGKVIWDVDLVNDFQGNPGDFGYTESPVVDEHNVYYFAGGRENNIVALERRTGELIWAAPVNRDYFSNGTHMMLELSARNALVGSSRYFCSP